MYFYITDTKFTVQHSRFFTTHLDPKLSFSCFFQKRMKGERVKLLNLDIYFIEHKLLQRRKFPLCNGKRNTF